MGRSLLRSGELSGPACLPESSPRMARRALDLRRIWGSGAVVRSNAPKETYDIASFPITDLFVVPSHSMVVFADFTNLAAYGADGLIWRSPRLALDELAITGAVGDVLHVTGFFGGRSDIPISVDLQTGLPRAPLPLDLGD